MKEYTKQQLRLILRIAFVSAAGSALFGLATSGDEPIGMLRAAFTGMTIAATLSLFELFVVERPAGAFLRRLPFLGMLAAKTGIYLAVFTGGLLLGPFLIRTSTTGSPYEGLSFLRNLLFSAAFALVFVSVLQVNRMLGQGELWRFVRGRYHRPREEERIFLFLDLVGSTSIAERIGGVRFLEMLCRLYEEIAETIAEHYGEIHKYVGDEVIVTWLPERGLPEARALACALAIEAELEARAERYQREFGVVPRFRAGLHLGPVVSGELGSAKREIAYLGDTVNTASRVVDACRSLGRDCLASQPLIDRVRLPPTIHAEPLGAVPLRGKSEPLPLFAVSAA